MSDPLAPLKIDPRFGYYPRWPEDGDAWIHPEDVSLARQWIPSPRIWRVESGGVQAEGSPLQVIRYGALRIRVLPALWQQTPEPAFALGDWVEVRTAGHQYEPHTGQIHEIEWDDFSSQIVFQITERGQPLPGHYRAEQLKAVAPPTGEPEPVVNTPPREALDGIDELVEGLEVDEHQQRGGW